MSQSSEFHPVEGGCPCGQIRYRVCREPMFITACHCHWCQRETGAAFNVDAVIEDSNVIQIGHKNPIHITVSSHSGGGQSIARCPKCWFAVSSHYGSAPKTVSFLRVGTLDEPASFVPDAHIFVESKVNWLILADDIPKFDGMYDREKIWPKESLDRLAAAREAEAKMPPACTCCQPFDIHPSDDFDGA